MILALKIWDEKRKRVMAKLLFKFGGGANRVKEGFQHRKHLGLIIYQYAIYPREKSGHSRMKKEEVVAKLLIKWGRREGKKG